MHIPQVYETTLVDAKSRMSIKALVVPTRSFKVSTKTWRATLNKFKLTEVAKIGPTTLPNLIASMLISSKQEGNGYRADECIKIAQGTSTSSVEPSTLNFAEQVAFQRLIPFEQSPLNRESLASLVVATVDADGRSSASLVTVDSDSKGGSKIPLILVSSSDGLVICGASPAMQTALQQGGVWERLLDWLIGK